MTEQAGDRGVDEVSGADALPRRRLVVAASQASLSSLGDYRSSLLARADAPPDAGASAYANLSRDGARWVPQLKRADVGMAGVQVLPWHGALRDAREAYLLRLRA